MPWLKKKKELEDKLNPWDYIDIDPDGENAVLDGEFSFKELEKIVEIMRGLQKKE